jgi:hypothetical protein
MLRAHKTMRTKPILPPWAELGILNSAEDRRLPLR